MSGASERANGRASGPVCILGCYVIDHSEVEDRCSCGRLEFADALEAVEKGQGCVYVPLSVHVSSENIPRRFPV